MNLGGSTSESRMPMDCPHKGSGIKELTDAAPDQHPFNTDESQGTDSAESVRRCRHLTYTAG